MILPNMKEVGCDMKMAMKHGAYSDNRQWFLTDFGIQDIRNFSNATSGPRCAIPESPTIA